jgi:hypothetical protein
MSVPINCFVIASLIAAAIFATKPAMGCIALLSIVMVVSANVFERMTK